MALEKSFAASMVQALRAEFNSEATFQKQGSLSGEYKVIVSYNTRHTQDAELRAIESRANDLAGRKLDRSDLEFKSGMNF